MNKVIVFNNVDKKPVIVSPDTTIDKVIELSGLVMAGNARPSLDGVPVHGRTHLTLKELGAGETSYLAIAANKDNN